jgi:hypothetical protein
LNDATEQAQFDQCEELQQKIVACVRSGEIVEERKDEARKQMEVKKGKVECG